MGKFTAARIVPLTCKAMWTYLVAQHMPYSSKERMECIIKVFFNRWNFSNDFGAIDGKHIRLSTTLINLTSTTVIVEDVAYPLHKHLLERYSKRQLDNERTVFNYRNSRARKVVECAWGESLRNGDYYSK
ncbi:hypothetical protein PR048_004653, partial [Dryococelus australis]